MDAPDTKQIAKQGGWEERLLPHETGPQEIQQWLISMPKKSCFPQRIVDTEEQRIEISEWDKYAQSFLDFFPLLFVIPGIIVLFPIGRLLYAFFCLHLTLDALHIVAYRGVVVHTGFVRLSGPTPR